MKSIWNETVIDESDDTIVVEGNHYFPQESIKKEFFEERRERHSYEVLLEGCGKLLQRRRQRRHQQRCRLVLSRA